MLCYSKGFPQTWNSQGILKVVRENFNCFFVTVFTVLHLDHFITVVSTVIKQTITYIGKFETTLIRLLILCASTSNMA